MKSNGYGKFITLEGADAAGKSTQIRLLAEALGTLGLNVLLTREPGGSHWSELMRGMLLSKQKMDLRAETLLHFAARADHVGQVIRPAIEGGTWVLCDRFFDSTMVYQGHAKGEDKAIISTLTEFVRVKPDLTIVLDISAPEAARRARRRGEPPDRYEAEGEDFQKHVRSAYRRIAELDSNRCRLIEADGTQDEVHRRVLTAVIDRFGLTS